MFAPLGRRIYTHTHNSQFTGCLNKQHMHARCNVSATVQAAPQFSPVIATAAPFVIAAPMWASGPRPYAWAHKLTGLALPILWPQGS